MISSKKRISSKKSISSKKRVLSKKRVSSKKLTSSEYSHKVIKHVSLKILYKYFKKLYQIVNDLNICFTKGVFIVDDNNNRLKEYLNFAKSIKLLPFMESHTDFNPYRKSSVCGGICEINIPLKLKCNYTNENESKRIIKWYTFNNSKDRKNPERFIFIKFEKYKSLSVKHGYTAFKRYVVKSKELILEHHRREDCNREGNCKCTKNNCKFCKGHICNTRYFYDPEYLKTNEGKCFNNIDHHTRIGDELFVNNIISNGILDSIKFNKPFFVRKVQNCNM